MKAFPITFEANNSLGEKKEYFQFGMDLRDYFAAKALPEIMANSGGYWSDDQLRRYALLSYKQADAMMKARGQE